MPWPDWWEWELELTPHLEKRMEDREFTEVDLRAIISMWSKADGRSRHDIDDTSGMSLLSLTRPIVSWWSSPPIQ
jgi:hypothetical protein